MSPRVSLLSRLLLVCLLPFLLGAAPSDAERFIAQCARTEATATTLCGLTLGADFEPIRALDLQWKALEDAPTADTTVHIAVLGANSGERSELPQDFIIIRELDGKIYGVSLYYQDQRIVSRTLAYAEERRLGCVLAGHAAKVLGQRGHYYALCGLCPTVMTGCYFSILFMHSKEWTCKAEGSDFCSVALFSSSFSGEMHLFDPTVAERVNNLVEEKRARHEQDTRGQ